MSGPATPTPPTHAHADEDELLNMLHAQGVSPGAPTTPSGPTVQEQIDNLNAERDQVADRINALADATQAAMDQLEAAFKKAEKPHLDRIDEIDAQIARLQGRKRGSGKTLSRVFSAFGSGSHGGGRAV